MRIKIKWKLIDCFAHYYSECLVQCLTHSRCANDICSKYKSISGDSITGDAHIVECMHVHMCTDTHTLHFLDFL